MCKCFWMCFGAVQDSVCLSALVCQMVFNGILLAPLIRTGQRKREQQLKDDDDSNEILIPDDEMEQDEVERFAKLAAQWWMHSHNVEYSLRLIVCCCCLKNYVDLQTEWGRAEDYLELLLNATKKNMVLLLCVYSCGDVILNILMWDRTAGNRIPEYGRPDLYWADCRF